MFYFDANHRSLLLETPYKAATKKTFSPFSIAWVFFKKSKSPFVYALAHLYLLAFSSEHLHVSLWDSLRKKKSEKSDLITLNTYTTYYLVNYSSIFFLKPQFVYVLAHLYLLAFSLDRLHVLLWNSFKKKTTYSKVFSVMGEVEEGLCYHSVHCVGEIEVVLCCHILALMSAIFCLDNCEIGQLKVR